MRSKLGLEPAAGDKASGRSEVAGDRASVRDGTVKNARRNVCAGPSSVTVLPWYVHPIAETLERVFERLEAMDLTMEGSVPEPLEKDLTVPAILPTLVAVRSVSC